MSPPTFLGPSRRDPAVPATITHVRRSLLAGIWALPVALRLQNAYDAHDGANMAMALLSCLPLLVMLVVHQRPFVAGLSRSGIR